MTRKTTTYDGMSVKTRQNIPYHFSKHKIKGEILKITEEKKMTSEEQVEFLYAVIQEQAIDLEKFRKRELKKNYEIEKSKLFDKLVHCYQKKVDIAVDRELKNHYFELREIINEMVKVDQQLEKFALILDDLK